MAAGMRLWTLLECQKTTKRHNDGIHCGEVLEFRAERSPDSCPCGDGRGTGRVSGQIAGTEAGRAGGAYRVGYLKINPENLYCRYNDKP